MSTKARLTKRLIRSKILRVLKNQKEEDRSRKSETIKRELFKSSVFKKAKRVMFYISFDGEVETLTMIQAARKLGKMIAVPVCRSNRRIAPCVLLDKMKLVKGLYGILEPVPHHLVAPAQIDLVVVPGVAFDAYGQRLGRGKGYYDRFLKRLPQGTATIGLAFDFQILPRIPATTRDVRLDSVIYA
jgi:5-formyltetrahydrofolate cyclo-ligase